MPDNDLPVPAAAETINAPIGNDALPEAKARFAKALEEAKGGAQALGSVAQSRAGAYADQVSQKGSDLAQTAKDKAAAIATDGKSRASGALSGLGQAVADNAPAIDDRLGPQYGDYARTAARSIQDAAARIDAKELSEIGDDIATFVRKSPGLAVGIAAAAGFVLARLFSGSDD